MVRIHKFLIALIVVGVLSAVPAHAGVAKFAYRRGVKPAAHASVNAVKVVEHAVVKSARFAVKVLW